MRDTRTFTCRCRGTGLCGGCSAGVHPCSCPGPGFRVNNHGICWECKGSGDRTNPGGRQAYLAQKLRDGKMPHEMRERAHAIACWSKGLVDFFGALYALVDLDRTKQYRH